jgi:PadR family transcriptional regulator PadR
MIDSWLSQVRKGVVELAVLAALREGEAYGYAILQRLRAVEGLAVGEGSLYPILARLTEEGCLLLREADSPNGPRRRYYRLSAAGRQRLADMELHWRALGAAIDGLLRRGAQA